MPAATAGAGAPAAEGTAEGAAQELKAQYGQGYEVRVRLRSLEEESLRAACAVLGGLEPEALLKRPPMRCFSAT